MFDGKVKIGDRIGALSHVDKENSVIYLYGYGVYLKDMIPPEGFYLHGIDLHEEKMSDTVLKLDNGTIVYGCYCWFSSEESIKKFEEIFVKVFYLNFNDELEQAKKAGMNK